MDPKDVARLARRCWESAVGALLSEDRERENAEIAYQAIMKMVELEGNWQWQRWNYFLAANALLFAGYAALMDKQADLPAFVFTAVELAGAAVSLSWWYVAVEGKQFYDMRVEQANTLEKKWLGMADFGVFAEGDRRRGKIRESWRWRLRASTVTGWIVPWAFVVLWVALCWLTHDP